MKIIKKTCSLNLTVLAALLLLIVCTSVLAYFTAADSSTNQWRVGYVDVIPKENYQPPDEIKPGIIFTKEVWASNVGNNTAYIRFKVVFSDGNMEKLCTLDYNTADYIYSDGYWYCRRALEPDCISPSLFTTVKVSETASQEDINNFDIIVYLEAHQNPWER